jgi:hypothetical protein
MRAAASRLAKLRPGSSQTSFSKTRQTLSEHQYAQEKKVWRRYRRLGTFSSLLAFLLLIVALTTDYWRLVDGKHWSSLPVFTLNLSVYSNCLFTL